MAFACGRRRHPRRQRRAARLPPRARRRRSRISLPPRPSVNPPPRPLARDASRARRFSQASRRARAAPPWRGRLYRSRRQTAAVAAGPQRWWPDALRGRIVEGGRDVTNKQTVSCVAHDADDALLCGWEVAASVPLQPPTPPLPVAPADAPEAPSPRRSRPLHATEARPPAPLKPPPARASAQPTAHSRPPPRLTAGRYARGL